MYSGTTGFIRCYMTDKYLFSKFQPGKFNSCFQNNIFNSSPLGDWTCPYSVYRSVVKHISPIVGALYMDMIPINLSYSIILYLSRKGSFGLKQVYINTSPFTVVIISGLIISNSWLLEFKIGNKKTLDPAKFFTIW